MQNLKLAKTRGRGLLKVSLHPRILFIKIGFGHRFLFWQFRSAVFLADTLIVGCQSSWSNKISQHKGKKRKLLSSWQLSVKAFQNIALHRMKMAVGQWLIILKGWAFKLFMYRSVYPSIIKTTAYTSTNKILVQMNVTVVLWVIYCTRSFYFNVTNSLTHINRCITRGALLQKERQMKIIYLWSI